MDTPQECNVFTEKLNWAPTSVKSPLNVGDDLPDFKKQSKMNINIVLSIKMYK